MGENKQSKSFLQKQVDDLKLSIESIESENLIFQKFVEIKTIELGMHACVYFICLVSYSFSLS